MKPTTIKRRIVSACVATGQIVILLCLADGVLDLGYYGVSYLARTVKPALESGRAPDALVNNVIPARTYDTFQRASRYFDGHAGASHETISEPGLHRSDRGERATPSVAAPTSRGLLLGASQAFGWYNTDEETLAAELQRIVPGLAMRNFATPGQRLDDNMLVWETLRSTGERFDFALAVNSFMPQDMCETKPPAAGAALYKAYQLIFDRIEDHSARCREPDYVKRAVDGTLYDFKAALAYARSIDVPLTIILPPMPYANKADVSNIANDGQFQYAAPTWTLLYGALRRGLEENPIPGVYDLMGAFDDQDPYFSDYLGHMSTAGQRILARAILDALGPDVLAPRDQKSK